MANNRKGNEPPVEQRREQDVNRAVNAMGRAVVREGRGGNYSVAQTILQQLGGNQFMMMTGAKNLVAGKDSLRFDIGKNGSQANQVKVSLRGDDSYDMEFWRKGRSFNPYNILIKYGDKYMGKLSPAEFNAKVEAATAKAKKNAEPKMLKRYSGIYFDQLQPLFTEYTKLYTKLF